MLHKEQLFEINNSNRLGTMRIDWYDGKIANQWNPTELLIKLKDSRLIDLNVLQEELNYIQFGLLYSFENVVRLCDGTGYDKETHVYFVGEFSYGIRLIPIRDSYSYIYVYNNK